MTYPYDAQARSYDWTRRLFLPGRRRLIDELVIKPGEALLEIGCGTGWNLPLLAERTGSLGRVVGLEISRGMLEKARARKLPPYVELMEGNAEKRGAFSERFDAILFSYSYTAIPDRETALNNAISWLRPGGRIGIVDFRAKSGPFLWWGKLHSCDFAADPLLLLGAAGFEIRSCRQSLGFSYRMVAFRGRGV